VGTSDRVLIFRWLSDSVTAIGIPKQHHSTLHVRSWDNSYGWQPKTASLNFTCNRDNSYGWLPKQHQSAVAETLTNQHLKIVNNSNCLQLNPTEVASKQWNLNRKCAWIFPPRNKVIVKIWHWAPTFSRSSLCECSSLLASSLLSSLTMFISFSIRSSFSFKNNK
jgi:hypothetical protein